MSLLSTKLHQEVFEGSHQQEGVPKGEEEGSQYVDPHSLDPKRRLWQI